MKPSLVAVVVVMLLAAGGCAQHGGGGAEVGDVRRENAELKSRVAALESEVAELKLQRTPLTVNGLTLGGLVPPPELKLTSTLTRPVDRDGGVSLGQGRLIYTAGGGDVAPTIIGSGTIQNMSRATTTTTTTKSSATSTSTTTTTPAK
jgi:hypothetical protein